jgi:hypothetical protein
VAAATGPGQLHQPQAIRGKCGDLDCHSPKCKGDRKECGNPGSCPLGNCISKGQCCCRPVLFASEGAKRDGSECNCCDRCKNCRPPVPPTPAGRR